MPCRLLAQPGGDQPQQVVAGVVAEAVVDLLEPVEVQQQQGAACGRRRRAAAAALLVEGAPVAQPGQLVGQGQLVAVRQRAASRKVTISRPRAVTTVAGAERHGQDVEQVLVVVDEHDQRAQGGADREAEPHPVGQQDPGRPASDSAGREADQQGGERPRRRRRARRAGRCRCWRRTGRPRRRPTNSARPPTSSHRLNGGRQLNSATSAVTTSSSSTSSSG